MTHKTSILLVEDEKNICDFISTSLSAQDYKITETHSGKEALPIITSQCPDLILLDEPTNALDESGVDMLGNIVKKEKERGAVLIVSSHDRDILEDISDEIYDLEQGEIVRHSIKGEKQSEG